MESTKRRRLYSNEDLLPKDDETKGSHIKEESTELILKTEKDDIENHSEYTKNMPDSKVEVKQEFSDDSDEEMKPQLKSGFSESELKYKSRNCPYLDTIQRAILDFDFEKLCSVSLSNLNVYACLICGKYFQGRGRTTHAYTHSVHENHHVFLNLKTLKAYCLPDNYEIIDATLEDIKYVLKPTFTKEEIVSMRFAHKVCRALDGTSYYQGIQGLNNIKANDYMNVILMSLCHVCPLREFFLDERNYDNVKLPPGSIMFPLIQRFGDLMRKLWNPRNFRSHISPHEMLQAVVLCSKKRFQFTKQGDPIPFLSWLLNSLHYTLTGGKIKKSSVVFDTFQGKMKVHTRKVPPPGERGVGKEYETTTTTSPFLYLMLNLPPAPLFTEDGDHNIIPQIPIYKLLEKYNNVSEVEHKTYDATYLRRFEITELPRYLVLSIKRFTENRFFVEKNPTIVNFPVSFDMAEYIDPVVSDKYSSTEYNLLANICHDGKATDGTYSVHLNLTSAGLWFDVQDLHVTKLQPQMITLSESYIQIYERGDVSTYKQQENKME